MKPRVLPIIVLLLLLGGIIFSGAKALHYMKQVERYKSSVVSLDRSILWEDKTVPYLKEVCEDIDKQKPSSTTDRIVRARKYVRQAFVCKYDEWYDKYKYDTPVVIATIYRHHQDPDSEMAHLDCQPACRALACILHYMDFKTRLVGFLTDDYDYVASHACLEVFNPETESWELHDVQYDLHFLDGKTRRSLSAIDLVFGSLENVIPTNGECDGWVAASKYSTARRLHDHYYEVLAYNHPTRKCFVLVNTDRVSLSKIFPKNKGMNMVEFLNRVYGYPPILGLPNGKYKTLPIQRIEQYLD